MGSLLAALGVVFVAELGDKTQLVALGFGARHRLVPVLVGLVTAYAATNLLSVLVGGFLGDVFPTRAVGVVGGALFLGFAAWTLRDSSEPAPAAERGPSASGAGTSTAVVGGSVAASIFVAELGDKTMLATATLAADGHPALVWVGATVGITLAGLLGVAVGRAFGARLPERITRIASAVLFAAFGVVLLAANV